MADVQDNRADLRHDAAQPTPAAQADVAARDLQPEDHTPLSRVFGTATPSRRGDDWRLTILFAIVAIAIIAAFTWCVIGWRESQHLVTIVSMVPAGPALG